MIEVSTVRRFVTEPVLTRPAHPLGYSFDTLVAHRQLTGRRCWGENTYILMCADNRLSDQTRYTVHESIGKPGTGLREAIFPSLDWRTMPIIRSHRLWQIFKPFLQASHYTHGSFLDSCQLLNLSATSGPTGCNSKGQIGNASVLLPALARDPATRRQTRPYRCVE